MPRTHQPIESSADVESPTPPDAAEPPRAENRERLAARAGGTKQRGAAPDPFAIAGDYAAGVRLFESRRDRQMAIKFDEKPSQPVIDKLKESGYRWNPADMVWTHPVRQESANSTRVEAERLYQEVRQMIRQEKGIEAEQQIPF